MRKLGWLAAASLLTLALVGPGTQGVLANDSGNIGTIKVHELGTPTGTESNDPKVCAFNLEAYGLAPEQGGYLFIETQGGDGPTGVDAGPFSFGPANADGSFETAYFNVADGHAIADGHYKATLFGKQGADGELTDVKAESKVFKVTCQPEPTPTPTPDPTPTPIPTPTPTPEATPTPTPTPVGSVGGVTGTPKVTLPPTDSLGGGSSGPTNDSWRILLVAMAGILASVLVLTPARTGKRRR
jgi:hypothetical protein